MLMQTVLYRLFFLAKVLSVRDRVLKFYHNKNEDGGFTTINGAERHERFSVESVLVLDLVDEYYVHSLSFAFQDGRGTGDSITVGLNGRLPHVDPNRACNVNDEQSEVTSFICRDMTRFIKVKVTRPFVVINITVRGHDIFKEDFVGCYDSLESPGVYDGDESLGVDLADCVEDCGVQGFPFAGVKNKYCSCFGFVNGSMSKANKCYRYCLEYQMCDGPNHMAMYLTGRRAFYHVDGRCISSNDYCRSCPNGLTGISCDYRDCSINRGVCGDETCESLYDNPALGGVCQCIPGMLKTGRSCSYEAEVSRAKLPAPRLLNGVNECLEGIHLCYPSSSWCKDTERSYQCICRRGFAKTKDSYSCFDIDECIVRPEACANRGACTNTIGSFKCQCRLGFKLVEGYCQDADECETLETCGGGFQCENSLGSYTCECLPGMERHPLCQNAYVEDNYSILVNFSVENSRELTNEPVQPMIFSCALMMGFYFGYLCCSDIL